MRNLVDAFPAQLNTAVEISQNSTLNIGPNEIQNILISGLGGSGIGGSVVSQIVSSDSRVPVTVNKDYDLPAFVGPNTLVIICSYSGDTEETVEVFGKSRAAGAEIVCITSGGYILETAQENGINIIQIPGGLPPRSAFGLPFVQLLTVFEKYNLVTNTYVEKVTAASNLLVEGKADILAKAEKVAEQLLNKTPIIYSASDYEGVGIRFRQQINENAKMLCWHHVLPEMNHNELVGWRTENQDLGVIILRNESDNSRTKERIRISKEIFAKYTSTIIEINSLGNNRIENTIYLIHLCDWISVILSEKKGVDSIEVAVIDMLKFELAKL
ncbi:MAG: bifunctional phosphoglucose/phosphomannose isomerase [Flavobacteriales bacterium]|nr:bifunctional phosphoglucose/phosphomannose isomerase [Flavobacteriales bacterium]